MRVVGIMFLCFFHADRDRAPVPGAEFSISEPPWEQLSLARSCAGSLLFPIPEIETQSPGGIVREVHGTALC